VGSEVRIFSSRQVKLKQLPKKATVFFVSRK
jgi:hypothetical protein